MTTTTATAEAIGPVSNNHSDVASLWAPFDERPPTEAEEVHARNHSLWVSNETSIEVDSPTDHYNPASISDEKRERYKKLDRHNRDNHWKYREDVDTADDYDRQLKLKTALGIASQLGLPDVQKQIVIDRLFSIEGRRFGQRTEAITFCLCAIVLNEDATSRYRDGEKLYHPARSDENNDREFVRVEKQLIATFGPVTKSRLHSIYAKLTQGEPPQRNDYETRRFVTANSNVQRRPSFTPDYALPRPTGEI